MEVAPELPAVPDALDMPAFQRVSGRVIIRWDIDAGRLPDHPGKAGLPHPLLVSRSRRGRARQWGLE